MQTVSAFGQVQEALSFIVASYTDIAEWRAVVERLAGFERTLERVHQSTAPAGGLAVARNGRDAVVVDGVRLDRPDGEPLIADVSLSLARGDRVLLSGPSGVGKSTLLRAIAGIWPFGHGTIGAPGGARALFLPQKPYLPLGTLRRAVGYPLPEGGVDDAALRASLEAVGLPGLTGRLDEVRHWALELSPGEQQRIAFARALVVEPEWLFLDEATSAVDETTERRLYALLAERLPGTTVLSVGHRETLRAFHDRRFVVQRDGGGPATIVEVTRGGPRR